MTEQNEINRTPTPGTAGPSAVDAFLLSRQSSTAGEAAAPPGRPNYRLDGGKLTCLVCGEGKMPTNRRRCWRCGTEFSDNAVFTEQSKPRAPQPEQTESGSKVRGPNYKIEGDKLTCLVCGEGKMPVSRRFCWRCNTEFSKDAVFEPIKVDNKTLASPNADAEREAKEHRGRFYVLFAEPWENGEPFPRTAYDLLLINTRNRPLCFRHFFQGIPNLLTALSV